MSDHPPDPRNRQSVSDTRVGGNLSLVDRTRGNVTIVNNTTRSAGVTLIVLTVVVAVVASGLTAWFMRNSAEVPGRPTLPLTISTTVNPIHGTEATGPDNNFLFEQAVEELPDLPDGYKTDRAIGVAWAYDNGGFDADSTVVEVVIQGAEKDKSVVLTGVKVIVTDRRSPPAVAMVKIYQASEPVHGREASIDLDSEFPTLTDRMNYSAASDPEWDFPLSVSTNRSEVLRLRASTEDCDCSWTAELSFTGDGKARTVDIDNNGEPFRTASSANATVHSVYDGRVKVN